MKSNYLKVGLVGSFIASLYLVGLVTLAQTSDQGSGGTLVQNQQSAPPPPPPPPPPPADNQPATTPPAGPSVREGATPPPPPPNNFREPQETQTGRQGHPGDFGMPSKPPMMQDGDAQDRMQKERMMDRPNFQGQQGEQRGTSNPGRNFEDGPKGPPGQGDGGDSEARRQKMEEEREKRDEQMVKRQAAQMAKMLQQNVNSISKRIARLKKAGISLTVECTETVTTLTDAIAKVKSASTREDLEDAEDAMHSMQDVGECRQIIERLLNAPRMLKNAATTVKNLKKRKVDVSGIETMLTALTTRFSALKTGGSPTNDDVEAFFDGMDNLGDAVAPLMSKPRSSMQGAAVFESAGFLETIKSWFGL